MSRFLLPTSSLTPSSSDTNASLSVTHRASNWPTGSVVRLKMDVSVMLHPAHPPWKVMHVQKESAKIEEINVYIIEPKETLQPLFVYVVFWRACTSSTCQTKTTLGASFFSHTGNIYHTSEHAATIFLPLWFVSLEVDIQKALKENFLKAQIAAWARHFFSIRCSRGGLKPAGPVAHRRRGSSSCRRSRRDTSPLPRQQEGSLCLHAAAPADV